MLLRASGQQQQTEYDLNSVTQDEGDPGVPGGNHLRAITEAAIRGHWIDLPEVRKRAEADMSAQQVVDTLVVAAAFNGITRVADATGIPLDTTTAKVTGEMRDATGIANFDYAEKSLRYG